MIDLSPFLTPYQRPNLAAPTAGADAISSLADFQAKQSSQADDDALAQRKLANQEAQTAINKSEAEGKNQYYADQVKLHQEQLKEKQDAEVRRQQDALGVAFRKAKTPEQRQLILQAFKKTGASYKEEASALPDVVAPGAEASQQGPDVASAMSKITGEPTPPEVQGDSPNNIYKARPANPKLLAGIQESAQGATPPAPSDEPFPWEMLGMGKPPPPAVAPPPPQGHGRHVVTDAQGNEILNYDEPLEAKQRGDAIRSAFQGLDAGSPEEKAAADKAINVASGYAQQTSDVEGAKNLALDLYKASLGEYKKKYPQGAGGAGGAPDEKHAFKVEAAVNTVLKDEDTRNKVAAIKSDHDLLASASALLAQGNGPAQTLAAVDLMRKFNGRAGNQAEFSALKGGPWMRLQSWVNGVTDENAPMPEALVKDLQSAVDAGQKTLAEHEAGVHEEARNVINSTNIPFRKGEKERALHRVDVRFGGKGAAPSGGETPEQKRKRIAEGG